MGGKRRERGRERRERQAGRGRASRPRKAGRREPTDSSAWHPDSLLLEFIF